MADDKKIEEVQGAIEAFEQILEAVPDDRVALQALFESYEELSNAEKAMEYLQRLASVVADETDIIAAPHLLAKLNEYSDGSKEVKALIDRLETLTKESPVAEQAAPTETKTVEATRRSRDITAEMTLAWNLLQAEELTQADYSQVVQDLSESVSKKLDVPVTVLHVLTDRGAKSIDRIVGFLSKTTATPFLHMKSYELSPSVFELLPVVFMEHAAAMPFTTMDDEVLVALLNPYDTSLREEVQKIVGRKCHFFMTNASEYDERLESIRSTIKAEADAKAEREADAAENG